jgi:hypothetical protein
MLTTTSKLLLLAVGVIMVNLIDYMPQPTVVSSEEASRIFGSQVMSNHRGFDLTPTLCEGGIACNYCIDQNYGEHCGIPGIPCGQKTRFVEFGPGDFQPKEKPALTYCSRRKCGSVWYFCGLNEPVAYECGTIVE